MLVSLPDCIRVFDDILVEASAKDRQLNICSDGHEVDRARYSAFPLKDAILFNET